MTKYTKKLKKQKLNAKTLKVPRECRAQSRRMVDDDNKS